MLAFSGLAATLALLGPHRLEAGPNICLYRFVFGRPCPACGMTRAMAALTRGQVRCAVGYNRFSLPLAFGLALIYGKDLYHLLTKKTVNLTKTQ